MVMMLSRIFVRLFYLQSGKERRTFARSVWQVSKDEDGDEDM